MCFCDNVMEGAHMLWSVRMMEGSSVLVWITVAGEGYSLCHTYIDGRGSQIVSVTHWRNWVVSVTYWWTGPAWYVTMTYVVKCRQMSAVSVGVILWYCVKQLTAGQKSLQCFEFSNRFSKDPDQRDQWTILNYFFGKIGSMRGDNDNPTARQFSTGIT